MIVRVSARGQARVVQTDTFAARVACRLALQICKKHVP
jgi:hypothetical protein